MTDLQHILHTGENEQVEFKTSFNDAVIETLVAFANARGGDVYVGISDHKQIIGIQTGSETLQNWINEIKQKTYPQIIPDTHSYNIGNNKVICLSTQEYPLKPVSFKGRFYKRVENSNHQMTIAEISDCHLKTMNTSWDFYPDPEHNTDSISQDKIDNFITKIGIQTDTLSFLRKFELLKENKITFGCFLLFADIAPLVTTIEAGRFTSETIIKDSITIRSDVINQVDVVLDYIKKHINKSYIISGKASRDERWEYPLDAVREIVVNMIVHRDYRSANDSQIKIFENSIEFFNPDKLTDELTIERVMSGNYRSHLRNKQLANMFKEYGYIEKYGSGIKRVIESFEAYGLQTPYFENTENGFLVKIYSDVTENVTENVAENVTDNRSHRILELLEANNKLTTSEIADNLGVTRRTIARDIDRLKSEGVLERIGGGKGGHWKVLR